jgi:hypothetical protein
MQGGPQQKGGRTSTKRLNVNAIIECIDRQKFSSIIENELLLE